MDRVLVFGVTGFLGRAFQAYVNEHHLHDAATFIGTGIEDRGPSGWEYHRLTVSDGDALRQIINEVKPTHILNLIGTFAASEEATLRLVNADFSGALCERVLEAGFPIRSMVFIGSAAEYGDAQRLPITEQAELHPISAYGRSKALQTELLGSFAQRGLPCLIARPFNIVGEGMSTDLSIGAFASRIRSATDGAAIETGDLSAKRDFLDAADVVDAFWKLLQKGKPGEIYNVCSGVSRSMHSLVTYMIEASGKQLTIHETAYDRSRSDVPESVGDPTKLQRETGWRPTHDILESVRRLVVSDE